MILPKLSILIDSSFLRVFFEEVIHK